SSGKSCESAPRRLLTRWRNWIRNWGSNPEMSSDFRVVYDSNILFSGFKRRIMLALARADIFQARWSKTIHGEWQKNLLEAFPDKFDRQKIEDLRNLIDSTVPDCLIHNYEPLISGLILPDKDDRHVLAAAIKSGAQVIVTCNTDDFPKDY